MEDNTYILYWRHGESEVVTGRTPAEAMNNAGIGAGAIPALDFYANEEEPSYEWKDKKWVQK